MPKHASERYPGKCRADHQMQSFIRRSSLQPQASSPTSILHPLRAPSYPPPFKLYMFIRECVRAERWGATHDFESAALGGQPSLPFAPGTLRLLVVVLHVPPSWIFADSQSFRHHENSGQRVSYNVSRSPFGPLPRLGWVSPFPSISILPLSLQCICARPAI